MSDLDGSVSERIDKLHAEAEELYDRARFCQYDDTADALRAEATRKVKQAAQLRARHEEDQ
ncbi:hypothetical protein ACXJJ3_32730 [Kribbella sp. WER1]